MLLSKVNRHTSGAVQPRKKILTQSGLKKFTQKRQPTPPLKFPAAATSQNKNKADATSRVKAKELELLPPSDSEDDWGSKSKAAAMFWRPLHRLSVKADNHSIKAQAKVEFDNISKRINKVRPRCLTVIGLPCRSRDLSLIPHF